MRQGELNLTTLNHPPAHTYHPQRAPSPSTARVLTAASATLATHTHTCLSRDDHAAEQVWNRCARRQKCQAHERRWQTARGGGKISSSSGTTKIRNLPKATFPKYFSMSQQACPFRRRQLTRTLRPALPSTRPSSTRIKLSSQWISRTSQPTSSPR